MSHDDRWLADRMATAIGNYLGAVMLGASTDATRILERALEDWQDERSVEERDEVAKGVGLR